MTPIVYLHGFASGPSSGKARFFRERLQAAGAAVSVPDLAEGDFEHLTISRQLEVIRRTAPHGPVSLIGSSLGGYLAALYAARHPEVERLVLLAPAFGFPRRWPERLGAEQMERWRAGGTIDVYHYALGRKCALRYDLIADAERYEDDPDFLQPVLIFHGEHDDVVPPAVSQRFAAGRSNVKLEIVDSGHELHNVLEPMWRQMAPFLGAR
ncbi:MAG TPA: YqiA/YcfP family alpha/beta fold hydrolase [Bryobacteraceae bacterium]|jgi:pimeloyl-ACP methyl ester carboxylesterase|nr:YqiA/YcfP family alpha/beta fold hydrolase [Bryobacteraceae bacterium]